MKTYQRKALAFPLTLSVTLCFTLGAAAAHASTSPLLGVQLWSVKDEVKQDFEGTLDKLAKLGFQGVEFAGEFGKYKADPAGLKAFLRKKGLQCAGAHMRVDQLNAANFKPTTDFYKQLGCDHLIISMDDRAASKDGSTELAKELSALSAKLDAQGMKLGYHNHEVEMLGDKGQTNWDVLAKNTPKNFILQQDVGWTTYAGKDPIDFVKEYPGRTVTTHYKAKFVKGTEGVSIIGQDKTDWAGLTKAVRSVGGTKWIIVEQEEYPNGMGQLESVAASMRGLQAVLAKLPAR
ncbi:Sugar phosphate isomerase/epimerase [Duganella sp. CF517]|uniref:sugar phosphate isomerase/epimerase family protein n=1 Tax=Duganella sp. CF517 TaxID=1881038 RepID=UPI0008CB7D05|nr:sugar phosphate isomerase/epimerase [Duganella sp. CF517]SEN07576.1 Sugar phosphate isomerase/epimerase [Duganella sp. CF517]